VKPATLQHGKPKSTEENLKIKYVAAIGMACESIEGVMAKPISGVMTSCRSERNRQPELAWLISGISCQCENGE
jgi:hypothetical protein